MRRVLVLMLVTCAPGEGPPAPPGPEGEVEARREPPREAGPATAPEAPEIPTPRTVAEYEALWTPLHCARGLRCGSIAASGYASCLREGRTRWDELLGVTRGVAAGRYRFDPEEARACLRVLAEAPCRADYERAPAGCLGGAVSSGLRPAVPAGGACERWEECVDGICRGELGCPGVCEARTMTVGGACGSNTLCGEALYCEEGKCLPRGDVGAACEGHWQACLPGLVCQGYVPENDNPHGYHPARPGVCERRRGAGEPCRRVSLGDDCEAGLWCDFGADRPVCRAPLPEGAACTWLDACADGSACDGLLLGEGPAANGSGMRALTRAGVCRAFGDHGSACDPEAVSTLCPSDTRCDAATRTCARREGAGGPCKTQNDCRAHHYCDPKGGACAPQAALGERCVPVATAASREALEGSCFLAVCDPRTRRCAAQCKR